MKRLRCERKVRDCQRPSAHQAAKPQRGPASSTLSTEPRSINRLSPPATSGGTDLIAHTFTRCLIIKSTRTLIRCLTNKSTRKEVAAERRSVPRSSGGWQVKVLVFSLLHLVYG